MRKGISICLRVFTLAIMAMCCRSECVSPCLCLGSIVDCSKSKLTQVPSQLPQWMQKLDLSRNPGLQLRDGMFQNLPHLHTLVLEDNGWETLPHLGPVESLKTLSLAGNKFQSMVAFSLEGFSKLLELDLSRNQLMDLPDDAFANVNLFRLNLSKNKLSSLSAKSFRTMTSLVELKLARNQLTEYSFNRSSFFANLPNLRSLDLSGNKLKQLFGLMFEPLKKVTILKLKRNDISKVSDGAFYGLNSITYLYLDYNGLTNISQGFLYGLDSLQHLSVSNNQIDSIARSPETWKSTPKLKTLDVSHNRMVSLQPGNLRGLSSLIELKMSNNFLSFITEDVFLPTRQLVNLDLSHNQLRWIIEDTSGAFNHLTKLESLSLVDNNIETIHSDAFLQLTALVLLDLTDNQLQTLLGNPFRNSPQMVSLRVNTSSLVCDCHLAWLPQWLLNNQQLNDTFQATCSYPSQLQGQAVGWLGQENLHCDLSPRPVINASPHNLTAIHGSHVTLTCQARAGGEGNTTFAWRKNDWLLVEPLVETSHSVVGGDGGRGGVIVNLTSLLHLHNVTHADAGDYQCVVRNKFGASYSSRAHMDVNVLPVFVRAPKDVIARVNDTVTLICAADGFPTPEISWQKDGGDDFPAARERRLQVIPNDDMFFINSVRVYDQGRYTCTAKNAVGVAMTHVNVVVHETPKLMKVPPAEKSVKLHDTAVLDCQCTGQPMPKVTWYKDGAAVPKDDRHVFVQENQFFLIVDAQLSDAGLYICMLQNPLGSVRAQIFLSITTGIVWGDDMTLTTGIITSVVLCCVVITSMVWLTIIYQTKKRDRSHHRIQPPPSEALLVGPMTFDAPTLTPPQNLPSTQTGESTSTPPLLARYKEVCRNAVRDDASQHSSGKDSGTGESMHRSCENLRGCIESLVCEETVYATLRRPGSCHPSRENFKQDEAHIFPSNLHCSRQYMATPIHANHLTTLRRNSSSRLTPVASPTVTSAMVSAGHRRARSSITPSEGGSNFVPTPLGSTGVVTPTGSIRTSTPWLLTTQMGSSDSCPETRHPNSSSISTIPQNGGVMWGQIGINEAVS